MEGRVLYAVRNPDYQTPFVTKIFILKRLVCLFFFDIDFAKKISFLVCLGFLRRVFLSFYFNRLWQISPSLSFSLGVRVSRIYCPFEWKFVLKYPKAFVMCFTYGFVHMSLGFHSLFFCMFCVQKNKKESLDVCLGERMHVTFHQNKYHNHMCVPQSCCKGYAKKYQIFLIVCPKKKKKTKNPGCYLLLYSLLAFVLLHYYWTVIWKILTVFTVNFFILPRLLIFDW